MLRPTMGTPPTPVGESATEEVLEDADLMVDESGDALLVDRGRVDALHRAQVRGLDVGAHDDLPEAVAAAEKILAGAGIAGTHHAIGKITGENSGKIRFL